MIMPDSDDDHVGDGDTCLKKKRISNVQVRLYPEMLCAGYKAGGKVCQKEAKSDESSGFSGLL